MKKKENMPTIKSATAEYLTYIANIGESDIQFEMRYEDENIWLTQKMMAVLYDVDTRTINDHIQKHKHKVLAIGGTDDHIHIFINYDPNQTIPSLMLEVKRDSSKWINDKKFIGCGFEWQEGYGVFSNSITQIDDVIKYIHNQEQKHKRKSSLDEYKDFLEINKVEYNENYVQ